MAVWDKNILWGFVFLLAGAVGQIVNYPPPVCAMKGSTVTLSCTFKTLKFAGGIKIVIYRVVWCKNHEICQGTTPSVYDSESINNNNNPRFRYLGDKTGNCTLQITDIQDSDKGTYRFRVETDHSSATFTGQLGVNVMVDLTPMTIRSSSNDREFKIGENVMLQCTAVCTFNQLEVAWFRDDHTLLETGPALQLGPLTGKDSGKYTCGLKSNVSTRSKPFHLRVEAEKEPERFEEAGVSPSVIAGLALGVLLVVLIVIVVICIIKRKRAAAADQQQSAVGGDLDQKHPDNVYSNILGPAEEEPAEDVSYAAVQFQHKKQARPVEEAEEAEVGVIYSSVASRG
ncbi:uncharacterized protein LOC121946015 [Plectropomus leopardus]|uniref:uncharacterized protein LOC121946015 n=1 Tax=Plectropomus leopardus TaxID=160734 RepID=UPI001C4CC701|nr:uncharacterized protein LOC121946015 [Plectropomus leopardus]XP_042346352.1 uncharacterized protein LOC121946015 [Plectropomus leopardus]